MSARKWVMALIGFIALCTWAKTIVIANPRIAAENETEARYSRFAESVFVVDLPENVLRLSTCPQLFLAFWGDWGDRLGTRMSARAWGENNPRRHQSFILDDKLAAVGKLGQEPPHPHEEIIGGRLARVGPVDDYFGRFWYSNYSGVNDANVSPQLPLSEIACNGNGFDSGGGRVPGFLYSISGSRSGVTSVSESPVNEKHAYRSQSYGESSREEHPKGPKRHRLLGVQVALIAASFGMALLCIYHGYQVADRGFDALDGGQKRRGILLFWGGISFAIVAGGASIAGGFSLAYSSWLWGLL